MPERKIITIESCYNDANVQLMEELIKFRKDFKIQQFQFQGKTVEYIVAGKGENTLLMFHGALGSADTPYNEILRLKDKFKVITPTIRDLGTLDHISNAINEIIKREQVGKLFVRGGSFGAFIAQSYFRRNFHTIDKMILINAIPPKGKYTKKDTRYVKLANFLFKIASEKLVKKIMLRELLKLGNYSYVLDESQQEELDFLMMQVNERLAKVRKQHIIESMNLVVEFDLNEKMDSIDFQRWNGRILLITDTDDTSYQYFEILKSQFPKPEVKVFENAGHILQIIYKSEFQRIHDDFLEVE